MGIKGPHGRVEGGQGVGTVAAETDRAADPEATGPTIVGPTILNQRQANQSRKSPALALRRPLLSFEVLERPRPVQVVAPQQSPRHRLAPWRLQRRRAPVAAPIHGPLPRA